MSSTPLSHYYIAGGIGDVCACLVSHPFDTVKVRQQISGELSSTPQQQGLRASIRATSSIIAKEGLAGIYRGLSASVLRQSTFSTTRHGGYATVCTILAGVDLTSPINDTPITGNINGLKELPPHPSKNVPLWQAIIVGTIVGGLAAFTFNPSDVALIRMQSDGHWPPEKRRNYRHVGHALSTIVRKEGMLRLWRGCGPTILRASLVTTTQLPTYHLTKTMLLNKLPINTFSKGSSDSKLHILASINSAAVASLATCPVDVIKTRIINMQKISSSSSSGSGSGSGSGGAYYTSAFDCVVQTVRVEGFRGMFKGLIPTFLRLGPHTVVLWNAQEYVLRLLSER
jgi:solute carrier family 25 oxoglutarate transporter 11